MVYHVGQIVEGQITGIKPYGAFVSIDANTSGLIHISELSDGFVRDVELFVKLGEKVKLKARPGKAKQVWTKGLVIEK